MARLALPSINLRTAFGGAARPTFVGLAIIACTPLLITCGAGGKPGETANAPQCSDGIDNDGDGLVDFPDDPGCTSPDDETEDSPPAPKCSDGRDNDGDGKIDFPDDPGCTSPNQDDETDDCPDGPHCPECSNGKDDDGNGFTDYPEDPGCLSASDTEESVDDPHACGMFAMVKPLPASHDDTMTLDPQSFIGVASTCGGGNGTPGFAYRVHVGQPTVIVASTDDPQTTADTIVDIRSTKCSDADSELACSDDISADNTRSTATASVQPGTYYIIVEGKNVATTGEIHLHVDLLAGEGQACSGPTDCGPGLVCRIPLGGTTMSCQKPMCSDGVDDDGDGKADYPDDPGCTSPDDNDETDDCPDGPNCPACSNGRDDDHDGYTDYPNDTSCTSAAGGSEACSGEHDPIVAIDGPATAGTLVGAHDDHMPACTSGDGGPDVLFTLTIPTLRSLHLDTSGSAVSDTVLSLLPTTCMEPSLACNDDSDGLLSAIDTGALAAGTYIVAVDAYSSSTTLDTFALNVAGVLEPGASCEPAQTLNGALACPTSNPCDGTVGSRICKTFQCSDGIDNDGDGKIDYPHDPGCDSPYDDDETDTCPGAGCPVCANTVDDDGDGHTDYAADLSCWAASGTTETFCNVETDRVQLVYAPTMTGDTTGYHDNTAPPTACQSNSTSPDVAFALVLPVPVTTLTIDTNGTSFDTVLTLRDATCGTPIACDDDGGDSTQSLITQPNVAAGTYAIVVDGYSTNSGPYTLHVNGVVAPGAACTDMLFTSGVLACPTGTSCTGGTCH